MERFEAGLGNASEDSLGIGSGSLGFKDDDHGGGSRWMRRGRKKSPPKAGLGRFDWAPLKGEDWAI
jgi:hypothetical protein